MYVLIGRIPIFDDLSAELGRSYDRGGVRLLV